MMAAGDWLTARGGPRNLGRGTVTGRMSRAPEERWRFPTGADIRYARTIEGLQRPAVLIQAGTTLQLLHWNGAQQWHDATVGVREVLIAGQLVPGTPPVAIVALDERTAATIDLRDGRVAWTWRSPPSSSFAEAGSWKVFKAADGSIRWVCFPTYATIGICFDLADPLHPAPVWEVDYGDTYDSGFGPHVIVADAEGVGRPQLVLSSRTGSAYAVDADEQRTTSAQLVLGRDDGHLYQAVVDPDTGRIRQETRYRPDPGDYPCARPYGLLQAVQVEGPRQDIVLVSCQVEEYYAVTRHDTSGLTRRWGAFVEKDWPVDRLELRPQTTSVARLVDGRGPELVVGLWDGQCWRTRILDIATGLDGGLRAELQDRYFWACEDVDGDGAVEIVVSVESRRTPGRASRLEVLDGATLEVKGALDEAALVTSPDSDLPAHIGFRANRRSPVMVTGQQRGLLVRTEGGIGCWGARDGQGLRVRPVADGGFTRADYRDGELILSDGAGRVARFDTRLREVSRIEGVQGRSCQPLAWTRAGGCEVVVELGAQRVVGLRPDPGGGRPIEAWQAQGTLPGLHRDGHGAHRLAVADNADPHHPRAVIHTEPGTDGWTRARADLSAPAWIALTPFGEDYRLLVNLSTGVHTAGLAVFDAEGACRWQDPDLGGHPQRPGVAPLGERALVLADDHGRLRAHDSRDGRLVWETDWTAAYTVAISLPDASGRGTEAVLRADGLHGVEVIDPAGQRVWRLGADLWAYYGGASAVGRMGGSRRLTLGGVTREGRFDAIDVDEGTRRWSLELGDVSLDRTVAAGDVDGDGHDEFLAGTRDGRLVCLGEDGRGRGVVRWTCALDASVTAIALADVDGDGAAEILVSTADGCVRMLGPRPSGGADRA